MNYREFVGSADRYDLVSAMQFDFLTALGLREHHYLLDIGCGSLRAGRLFIPYLSPAHYFGIEPEEWLIEEGIKNELGEDIIKVKKPTFSNDSDFTLSTFNQKFDFLLAHSVFVHAPKSAITRCISEAKKVMKPDSIFVATILFGDKDYEGGWTYPTSQKPVEYTKSTINSIVEAEGLVMRNMGHKQGSRQFWLGIVNPGNERAIEGFMDYATLKRRLDRLESNPIIRFAAWLSRMIH